MDKVAESAAAAVADVPDGATLLFGGFGVVQGWPNSLLLALRDHGARDLTVIFNTPGVGPLSAQLLAEAGLIRRVIASFAAYPTRPTPIEEQIKAGRIELELVPQGTLAERVRAGGAGIPAFYTPTGAGTLVAEGKERRTFGGREYVLETALTADYALVRAQRADRHGNLVYRRGARNLHPVFATGGRLTLAEVDEVVAPGEIDPECVVTPGIYVDRVVRTEHPLDVEEIRALSRRYGQGLARGGRVTTVVLGAFQVSEKGDLANWNVPASGKGGIGGAMDLAAGRARVLVVTYHTTRAREPKLVRRCTYPLTAPACVRDIVTDLAYLTVEPEGFVLRELAPGVPLERVRQLTGAPLRVVSNLREMEFS